MGVNDEYKVVNEILDNFTTVSESGTEENDEERRLNSPFLVFIETTLPDILVGIGYAVLIYINIRYILSIIYAFIYVDINRFSSSAWSFFSLFIFSVVLWLYSTSRTFWNYYNKKFFGFFLVFFTVFLRIISGIYYLNYMVFIPHISRLEVTELMTEAKIAGLGWISTIVPTVLISFYFGYKLIRGLLKQENRDAIKNFKIMHYLHFYSKFDYNIRCIRNMSDGGRAIISYIDRFLHGNIVGATGTAKTSSIILPIIKDDLNTKVLNEDAQKKVVEILIKKGRAYIVKPFPDSDYSAAVFGNGYIKPVPGYEELFKNKIHKYLSAGITVVAPDPSMTDEVYKLCKNRGIKCNRIDPSRNDDGTLKEGSIGFNPLYISPLIEDWAYRKEMVKKATLVADVMQLMFEMSGKSDPYFSSVNRIATTTACMVVMMVHSRVQKYKGQTPTLKHVQRIINNFSELKLYKDELYRYNKEHGEVYQPIIDIVNNQFLGSLSGNNKFEEHCSGLRIQLNNFLLHPDIERILCCEETIDMDAMLRDGDVTVVNIELGDLGPVNSPCFGLFVMISFIDAVLRRKGSEWTRLPHFLNVDELPIIMCQAMESCYTLFRKYRCAMLGAIQTLDQMDKTPFLKYMKGVILSSCSHHFVFGRASINDMMIFSKLSGLKEKQSYTEMVSQTPLSVDKPSLTVRSGYTAKEEEKVKGSDIRNRDFQEITFFTVKDGKPLDPSVCKVNFLSKSDKRVIKRRTVDWMKLYNQQPYKPDIAEIKKLESEEINKGRITGGAGIVPLRRTIEGKVTSTTDRNTEEGRITSITENKFEAKYGPVEGVIRNTVIDTSKEDEKEEVSPVNTVPDLDPAGSAEKQNQLEDNSGVSQITPASAHLENDLPVEPKNNNSGTEVILDDASDSFDYMFENSLDSNRHRIITGNLKEGDE